MCSVDVYLLKSRSRPSIKSSIEVLKLHLRRNPNSALCQKFMSHVLRKRHRASGRNDIVLTWCGAAKGKRKVTKRFISVPDQNSSPKSSSLCRKKWNRDQADVLDSHMILYTKEQKIEICMLDMGQADYDEANLESGSTFYEPVWDTPGIKSTGGGMHTMNGHVNHTFKGILVKVREKRKNCKWQQRV